MICIEKGDLIMSIHIREMKPKDIEAVQGVAKASWETTYAGIIPLEIQEKFIEKAYSFDMMHKRIEASFLYVAVHKGEIIGFANFSPVKQGGIAEMGAIYLLCEYQGKGIGTDLLREGIKKLIGVHSLFIDVEKENEIGVAFYQAKGFKTHSEFEDDLYGHKSKMIRMVLEL